MKLVRQVFFSRRNIFGILLGAVASFIFISLMKNYVLASILGMMITLIIVDLRQPSELAMLGFVTGSMAGLYSGARNYVVSMEVPVNLMDTGLITSMLGGLILTGLICGGYAFVLGIIFRLLSKGERPFF